MPHYGGMSSPKVLVTGATGLIGKYALSSLMEKGFSTLGASRSGEGLSGVSLNIHDTEAVNNFIKKEKPDYLLHLAWNVDSGYMSSSENLDWIVSSLNLLKIFAQNGGKRAVFAGTCIEYDWRYGFLSEDFTPLESTSVYGSAKASLHKFASKWAENINLSFAWGHIFFLYGKGERNERIVPYIVDSFLKGEKPILKNPYILRDYMYAGDIADGLIALLFSDFKGSVNIASGSAVTLCDIAKKVAMLTNCSIPEYEYTIHEDNIAPIVLGDTRRLNNIIGFKPKVSWEDGLCEIIKERRNLL